MEEVIYLNELYDFYGSLLTDKQRDYFENYYFNNLSLGEMAENYGVSRNAIHKQLKIVEERLKYYEENLELLKKSKKAEELVQKIQGENWFEFDIVVATPDMMGVVGRLGRVLGPKGLMPNPKSGTVTFDVAKAIDEIKAGKVEYRLDKTNIIHVPVGKVSFGGEKLAENFAALMDAIVKAKPAAAKGQYLRSVTVASTMGPGVKINPAKIAE